jgi:hypothetical protein
MNNISALLGHIQLLPEEKARVAADLGTAPSAVATAIETAPSADLARIQAAVSGDTTAQASARTLTAADINDVIHVSGAPAITIPTGLGTKFRCAIYGTATIAAGSGVTIVDTRGAASTAAICVVMSTAVADNYVLIGGVL